ncbi:MAG: site-2 protease family protein [Bacteroidetes bacterium]|nr:MAG: site-2 protease family protein [Bacteroidota bacterium]
MFNINIATFVSRAITLIIAFTIHEFAHAWTADYFGDSTPRINGRLTLNPLAHLDPIGSLMLLLVGFGWAKPVPVNPYTLRQRAPSALMWVSLAGPLSNFLLALIASIPFQLALLTANDVLVSYGSAPTILPTAARFLYDFMTINLVLALFNLIPLPPLDGDKIAEFFMPDSWKNVTARIRPYGPVILILLFMVGPRFGVDLLGWIIREPLYFLMNILIGI